MRIRLKYNIITQWAEMSFGTHGGCTVVISLQPPHQCIIIITVRAYNNNIMHLCEIGWTPTNQKSFTTWTDLNERITESARWVFWYTTRLTCPPDVFSSVHSYIGSRGARARRNRGEYAYIVVLNAFGRNEYNITRYRRCRCPARRVVFLRDLFARRFARGPPSGG